MFFHTHIQISLLNLLTIHPRGYDKTTCYIFCLFHHCFLLQIHHGGSINKNIIYNRDLNTFVFLNIFILFYFNLNRQLWRESYKVFRIFLIIFLQLNCFVNLWKICDLKFFHHKSFQIEFIFFFYFQFLWINFTIKISLSDCKTCK